MDQRSVADIIDKLILKAVEPLRFHIPVSYNRRETLYINDSRF